MLHITAPFSITAWEPADEASSWPASTGSASAGPAFGRVTIRKTYSGRLDGEGVVVMLTCLADPADPARGAVYTALEQFTGRLDGREGTFAFQHGAVSGGAQDADPTGVVVPNSGTGALAGIAGTVGIAQGPDDHTLTLNVELP